MTSTRLTTQQAMAMLAAAAETSERPGKVHRMTWTASGEILPDWQDVNDALWNVERVAQWLSYEPGPFGHNLAMLHGGIITRFYVPQTSGMGDD